MTEPNPPTPFEELGERLKRARERSDAVADHDPPNRNGGRSGAGIAFRVGVELVAALAVGVGFGLVLDYWLGTAPLFLILLFLLGAATGVMNVYRAAGKMFTGGMSGPPSNGGAAGAKKKKQGQD
jgi:ATP synthase protein I